jgi:hypothetical protein
MAGLNWPANHAIGFWKLGALALDRLLIRFGWIGPAEMWEKMQMVEERHRFQLWQDGIMVAAVDCANRHSAMKEIAHYAVVYEQDGPVKIVEVKQSTRRPVGRTLEP